MHMNSIRGRWTGLRQNGSQDGAISLVFSVQFFSGSVPAAGRRQSQVGQKRNHGSHGLTLIGTLSARFPIRVIRVNQWFGFFGCQQVRLSKGMR
jgi:hypothetical protein